MPTLLEIQKNFETAPIVLCGGGSIDKKVRAGNIDIDKVRKEKKDTSKWKFQPLLEKAAKLTNRKDLEDYVKSFVRRDDVWAIYLKDGANYKYTIAGIQCAFELLIKEEVDTIYWFSDFVDEIDPDLLQELTAKLKEKNIKVVAHNFSGGQFIKSAKLVQDVLVKETGGTTIRIRPTPIK